MRGPTLGVEPQPKDMMFALVVVAPNIFLTEGVKCEV